MSVYIRPIKPEDKKRMAPSEKQIIKSSPMIRLDAAGIYENNVVSNSIFGKADHSNDPDCKSKVYEDKFTRVGYIELTRRVLNPFLSGRKAPIWRAVLGMDEKKILNIINGNIVYDIEEDKEYAISDIGTKPFDIERYMFGADYLEYLLDKVDVIERLYDLLIKEFLAPCLTKYELSLLKEDELEFGDIMCLPREAFIENPLQENQVWLFGTYILDMSNSQFSEERRQELLSNIYELTSQTDAINLKQFPIISILTTLLNEGGKDSLKSQILSYLFVLPYGYRPTIDKRVDALTTQYNKLTNANLELRDILDQTAPSCYAVMNKYREVVQYVRNIFIGDDQVIRAQGLKNYKSISDTITGKEGLMRGRMQGARVDNSARTVITCDPNMPITCIGVPRKILKTVAEPGIIKGLRNYKPGNAQNSQFGNRNLSTFSTTSSKERDGITFEEYMEQWFKEKDRYGVIGRQPTLFYLGMQGFKIIPIDGDAIVLSPLIVMPFNADFDGDQMHFNMPVTSEAVKEVRENMLFVNNLRYPKNGEITVVTRHEIIYGLWVCLKKCNSKTGNSWNESSLKELADFSEIDSSRGLKKIVYEAVCSQYMNIYDDVNINGRSTKAGVIALEYAVYGNTYGEDLTNFKIKAKAFTSLLDKQYGTNTNSFLNAINRMVKLGFRVAKVWPPNISTIIDSDIQKHVQDKIEEFNINIIEREELLNRGLEIESQFTAYFNSEWDKLKKYITKYLIENLDEDNGYMTMMLSGGKGDENNILQIFGLKGRVQKNDTTAFNSIISGSYSRQLTGLEGFVSAYGSRKGISDKVLATAKPGYLSRKLEHAGSIISVTSDDCETTNGMEFRIEDIVPFLEEAQISRFGVYPNPNATDIEVEEFWNKTETKTQYYAAKEYLSKIIMGRWCVNSNGVSEYISSESEANAFINRHWGCENREGKFIPVSRDSVIMRSPVYCDKPCCTKCYGKDIAAGTHKAKIGRPIGFIAAQAVGEPGTQLTMKNFQKGGVVSDANLTSSFELIEDYFELHDFSKKKKNKRGVISYDMISPVTGFVKEQYLGNGSKRILVTATDDPEDRRNLIAGTKKIIVHSNVKLKEFVNVGDSFQKIQGNLNMKEVLKYRGYDKAASYLSLILYSTFGTQDVNFKHFETLVAAMTCAYLLTDANTVDSNCSIPYGRGSDYKTSSVLTRPEYCYSTNKSVPVAWTIIGLKNLPKYKTDFFESLLMENMDSYIPRAILMNPNDSMTNPITRAAFGLNIGIGSDMRGN